MDRDKTYQMYNATQTGRMLNPISERQVSVMKCIIRTALVGLLLSLLLTGCSSGVGEPGTRVNGSDAEEIEITTNHEQTEENKNKAPGLSQYHEEPFYEKEAELVRLQDGSMKRSSIRIYGQESQQGFTLEIDDLSITVRSDSLSGDTEIVDLKEDTKAVAIGAIDPAGPQCLAKSSEGVEGWFAVDDYSIIRGTDMRASQIFEGYKLCRLKGF